MDGQARVGGKKTGDDGDMEKRGGSESSGGKHEAQADTSPWQIKHTCRPARRGEKKNTCRCQAVVIGMCTLQELHFLFLKSTG